MKSVKIKCNQFCLAVQAETECEMTKYKRFLAFALCSAITAAVFLSGCSGSENNIEDEIYIPILDDADVNFSTVTAEITDLSTYFTARAQFSSPYYERIGFTKASGVVTEMNVKNEVSVSKGDVLVVLNSEELEYQIEQQELKLNSAKKTYDTRVGEDADKNEIEYAKIDYEVELAEYERLTAKREDYVLTAPCDGRITYIDENLRVGASVSQGRTLIEINDTTRVALCASTGNQAAWNLPYGTQVSITQGIMVETTGTLVDIVDGAMNRKVLVINLNDPNVEFEDFGNMDISIVLNSLENVIAVPKEAVKELNNQKYVNVLANGIKMQVDVETGLEVGDSIEIISGLSGGEELILN